MLGEQGSGILMQRRVTRWASLTVAATVLAVTAGIGQQPASPRLASPPVADANLGAFFGADAYPAAAIRARQQGRVVARLRVDETGKVIACSIDVSSDSEALDQTTCAIARGKFHYKPATDDRGHAVAATVTLPVRWSLPEGVRGVVIMAREGRAYRCTITQQGIVHRLKPEPCQQLGAAMKRSGHKADTATVGELPADMLAD
jgi:TonB family protein